MVTTVCTLFEGDYHYGVAGLVNSLYKSGFKGNIYVGYRGELPPWAKNIDIPKDYNWEGAKVMKVESDIFIHFLPVDTNYHLTNYKPDFMLALLAGPADDSDAIFYYDPDIVLKTDWIFFEKWVNYGIAVVHEIVMHDMPPSHPYRSQWAKVLNKLDLQINNNLFSYINAGFLGLKHENYKFLNLWKEIMECAFKDFDLKPNQFSNRGHNRHHPFYMQDQDAFNIALMGYNGAISEAGPEFMDFIAGGNCMSHATSSPKPWKKNFFRSYIKGLNIRPQDRFYWENVDYPIQIFSNNQIKIKKLAMKLFSFLSRFYKK